MELNEQQQMVNQMETANQQTQAIIDKNKERQQRMQQDPAGYQRDYFANNATPGFGEDTSAIETAEVQNKVADDRKKRELAKTDVYDFRQGRYLNNIDDNQKTIGRTRAANMVGDALWKLYQVNPNPSDDQIEAALAKNAYAFNNVYGRSADSAATFFGAGQFLGKITPSQRAAVEEYIKNRRAFEDEQNNTALQRGRAEHEKKYVVKLGDQDIAITKEVSDGIKGISAAYGRVLEEDAKRNAGPARIRAFEQQGRRIGAKVKSDTPMPEDINKGKRQQLVGALRAQLNAAGFNLGEAPKEGEFDNIQDLINSAPDYETENALIQALQLANTRTEYAPEQKSVEDRIRERQAMQEEVDMQTRNRELARAKSRAGFVGLAASIGDMIRASEGARVDPREWQNIYDNLTAQERANVDNYRVRMAKMHEDARQERLAAKAAAAAALEKQKDRDFKRAEREGQNDWQGDQNDKDRALKWWMHLDKMGQANSGGSKSNPYTRVMLGDTAYQIPKGDNFKNYAYSILQALKNDSSWKSGKVDVPIEIINEQELNTDPWNFYNKNIVGVLRSNWSSLTPAAQDFIIKTTSGYGGSAVSGSKPSTTQTSGSDGDLFK